MAVRVDIDTNAVRSIARSNEVRADLQRRANRVANAAKAHTADPSRIEATSYVGRNRARASVMNVGGLSEEHRDRILGIAITAAVEIGVSIVVGAVAGSGAGRAVGAIAGEAAGAVHARRSR
jgi:phage I-like protein